MGALLTTYTDPEISTLTTLNNVQNAMFVPDIPFLNRFYNRHPTYELSRNPTRVTEDSAEEGYFPPQITRQWGHKPMPPTPGAPEVPPKEHEQERIIESGDSRTQDPNYLSSTELRRTNSITSHIEDDHYAVLPHGVTLEGWSEEDVEALDDYVRHMLHSRRNKFKRSMRGFGKYIRKRKSLKSTFRDSTNLNRSSRLLRHSVRVSHHGLWSNLGTLPHRLDFRRLSERLHRSHCRLRLGRSLRHHG